MLDVGCYIRIACHLCGSWASWFLWVNSWYKYCFILLWKCFIKPIHTTRHAGVVLNGLNAGNKTVRPAEHSSRRVSTRLIFCKFCEYENMWIIKFGCNCLLWLIDIIIRHAMHSLLNTAFIHCCHPREDVVIDTDQRVMITNFQTIHIIFINSLML